MKTHLDDNPPIFEARESGDERGKTAEDWAKVNGHEKVVGLLQSHMGT